MATSSEQSWWRAGYRLCDQILGELERAEKKFPGQSLEWGGRPNRVLLALAHGDMAHIRDVHRALVDAALRKGTATWLDVIMEEVLEAGAEEDWAKARGELIQVGAMVLRTVLDVDSRQLPVRAPVIPPAQAPDRAPDGAPWYAHMDGPCGPECQHAPDGGNHTIVGTEGAP